MNLVAQIVRQSLATFARATPNPSVAKFIMSATGPTASELLDSSVKQDSFYSAARAILPSSWGNLSLRCDTAQIANDDFVATESILKAIEVGLAGNRDEVARAALVLVVMENWCPDLIKYFFDRVPFESKNVQWVINILPQVSVNINSELDIPVYEQDALFSFRAAVDSQDFQGISKFLNMVVRGVGLPRIPIVGVLICLATKAKPSDLSSILEAKVSNDFLAVHMILTELPVTTLLQVALQSSSKIIKLDALAVLAEQRSYYKESFNPDYIAQIIRSLLKTDDGGWEEFCRYFGEYPARTPNIWWATGVALHGASSIHIKKLLKFFNPGRYHPAFQELVDVLQGLLTEPHPQTTASHFLQQTETKRKEYFRLRRRSLEDGATELEFTSFYRAVLNSLLATKPLSHVKKQINALLVFLQKATFKWFKSENEMRTYVVLFASYLLPYFEAYQHLSEASRDPVFEKNALKVLDYYYGYFYLGMWNESEKYIKEIRKMLTPEVI